MPNTRLFAWLIRYASFILTNYHIRTSGQTARFMIKGSEANHRLCAFGECVMWKWQDTDHPRSKALPRWQKGIWVGISEPSGQHIVLTQDGAEVVRNISRLPREDQWDVKLMAAVAGTPWSRREGARGVQDMAPVSKPQAVSAPTEQGASVHA